MAKIKRINVSEINGGNNAVLPRGTLALYENNNRWALRLHDGATNGGEPVGDTGDVRFFGGTIVNRNSNESINIAPGGESTSIVYVPGNSQSNNEPLEIANRSETGSVRIGAGGFNWNFVNGGLQLPSGNNANYTIGESMPGLLISSDNNLAIFTNAADEVHAFMFTDSGSLMFPNGSQQTTAYVAPTIDTTSATANDLADAATANLSLTGGRAYVMYKIQTSHAAWVRIYINEASRTADASRLQGVDPGITSGVVAEAITAGAETVVFAPAVNGFNDESPTTNVMPVAVTNLSGSTNSITVTVTKMTMVA